MGNQLTKQQSEIVFAERIEQPENESLTPPPSPTRQKTVTLGDLKSLQDIDLSHAQVTQLSENIGELYGCKTLILNNNLLKVIPFEIGHLTHLMELDLCHNQLAFIPEHIGLLENLVKLSLSHNLLKSLPISIKNCKKLVRLQVDHNHIENLPVELGLCESLTEVIVSHNPIKFLPIEFLSLKLVELRLEETPITTFVDFTGSFSKVSSLKELCARDIIDKKLPVLKTIREDLHVYLASHHKCSHCEKVYFENFERRVKVIRKFGINIPFEYRLCSDHWSNEQERIIALFAPDVMRGFRSDPIQQDSIPPTQLRIDQPRLSISRSRVSLHRSRSSLI